MNRFLLPALAIVAILVAGCAPIQPAAPPQPAAAAATSAAADEPLPFDPDVRTGTLDNGLRYFVRANQEPENRAELWLVVDAGSTDEEDDQRGLAHFLEHMLFNGTQEYPATALVNFLESIGMEFGPDVNAYTSFDETVYTLQTPTDNTETLAKGLDVLKEWASAALIDPVEVDKERGVVTEEWRMRDLNAQGRVTDEMIEGLLRGSRYAERLPIGDMGIIGAAPADTVRRFYEMWYRPDNMAVIAVGDFDPDKMVEEILSQFGGLQNPDSPRVGNSWEAPDLGATHALVISDPEFPATYVDVEYRQAPEVAATVGDYRSSLVTSTAIQILNYRFDDLRRSANPPFLAAWASVAPFVRAADQSSVSAQVEEGGIEQGLTALMTEAERLRRFGVTASELERARTEMLRGFEQAAAESANIPNADHAGGLRDAFLTGSVPVRADDTWQLAQTLIPTITAEEIQDRAKELFPHENRLVLAVAPEREGVSLPDDDALLAVVTETEASDVTPPAEAAAAGALLEDIPEPAAIVSEESVDAIGAQVLTLSNGIRVWIKPTDFKSDEVLFELASPGGLSMVDDADVSATAFAPGIASDSGVGALTQSELQRALAGKNVGVQPWVDDNSEGISGSASPSDLETMLQLVYLYATQPRMDADALALFQRSVASWLADRDLAPESAIEDRLTAIRCPNGSPRCDDLAALKESTTFDTDSLLRAYQDRFANLGDATALLVGNVDVATLKPLLERYIGTLPTTNTPEVAVDRIPATPRALYAETIEKGIDPSSAVLLSWETPLTPTVESRVALRALEGALDIRLREVLREEMGAIYGAGVGGAVSPRPDNEYNLTIQFTVAPTRAVEAVDTVQNIVADLRENGPSADVLERAKQTLLSDQEENLKRNEAWLAWLGRYAFVGEGPVSDILTVTEAIQAVTPEDVRAMAQEVLSADARVQLILYPEGYTP